MEILKSVRHDAATKTFDNFQVIDEQDGNFGFSLFFFSPGVLLSFLLFLPLKSPSF